MLWEKLYQTPCVDLCWRRTITLDMWTKIDEYSQVGNCYVPLPLSQKPHLLRLTYPCIYGFARIVYIFRYIGLKRERCHGGSNKNRWQSVTALRACIKGLYTSLHHVSIAHRKQKNSLFRISSFSLFNFIFFTLRPGYEAYIFFNYANTWQSFSDPGKNGEWIKNLDKYLFFQWLFQYSDRSPS